jgi:hypothetical protein
VAEHLTNQVSTIVGVLEGTEMEDGTGLKLHIKEVETNLFQDINTPLFS